MPRGTHILALDQGTTSSRAIVFDQRGQPVASAQKEFRQYYPAPGLVEHDPFEIWSSQNAAAAEVLARANLSTDAVAAVGITNQRETTLIWNRRTGSPIHPAIVWQDRRTAPLCQQLRQQGLEPLLTTKTGLRLDPYFSATKIAWLLDNVPGARTAAEAGDLLFGTVDTWLLYQLTGKRVHATDISNASRTLLFNLENESWDSELLEVFQIPPSLLPQVRSSSEIFGYVDSNLFPAGVPISGIAGDQHAALFGQACFHSGMAKNTYGTGCFLLQHTGDQIVHSSNNLLTTVAWKIGDRTEYALEGSVFVAGAVFQWLRDQLQLVRSAEELDALAASVPDANGLFLVPAFTGLGAPHWDPHARGLAIGITRGTSKAHLCRAALESVAFQVHDLIIAMQLDSGLHHPSLRVDGGAARSDPLLRFQSDLLQREVVRPKCTETTALGAAYLAGLAVGFWENRETIESHWEIDATFRPTRSSASIQTLLSGWTEAVQRSLAWHQA
ncbi:MAG: glycerol kinase GlpK [Puniceicoccaceae bacterium]